MLLMLVALNAFLWTMTGFSLCWATHRQRGLEADCRGGGIRTRDLVLPKHAR